MSPDLEHLIELQNLESAIEESRRRITAHPQRVADADARLAHAKEVVDAAKQRLKASQEARREQVKEAATYQSRLSKFKEQLSAVKTNREYQAMQHEMETAQKELGTVEEASVAVARLLAVTHATYERRAQLEHALQSRIAIEQAKGVVAERYGLDLDDAFQLIRRAARTNRMKLHDLVGAIKPGEPSPPELVAVVSDGESV